MTNARRARATNVRARINVAATKLPMDDYDAAHAFAEAAKPFSSGDLAKAARRTKAAAKGWKEASRAPGLASVINMARALPAVREWLMAEIDAGNRVAEADLHAIVRAELERMQRK